jgi:hypothetical protein
MNQAFLLGDEGYGIAPFLMTPYSNPVSEMERRFNAHHARNRVIVENAFGQLKRRFPILRYGVSIYIYR